MASKHGPLQDEKLMPLLGKRIMITAPRQYATKLASCLIAAGARPVWLPSITITHITRQNLSAVSKQLGNLSQYSDIAFTSRNGIHAVMELLQGLHGSHDAALHALQECRAQCWALGADAEALRSLGVQNVQTPPEASTQGLVRELQRQGRAEGARVLCPVPLVTGGLLEPPVVPRFLKALEAAGAEATRLEVYQTASGSDPEACKPEKQLLLDGSIHAIAFTSTAEAQGLSRLMGGAEVVAEAMNEHGVVLAAHGPYSAAGASLPLACSPAAGVSVGAGVTRRRSVRTYFFRSRTTPVTGGEDYRASDFGLTRPDVWIGRLHSVVKVA
ncbi:hypothetical protein ABBQ38_014597 [Trebouxia sp. C0009 RCD-2024]